MNSSDPLDVLARIACVFFLAMQLASCAHEAVEAPAPSSQVGYNVITAPDAKPLELAANEIFVLGDQVPPVAMPQYPEALLPMSLTDQPVCVQIVIEADGTVSKVTPVYRTPACPAAEGAIDGRFVAAVVDAVSNWEFFSSTLCRYPPGTPEEKKCSGEGVTVTQIPITQAFGFVFSVKSGVATVSKSRVGK